MSIVTQISYKYHTNMDVNFTQISYEYHTNTDVNFTQISYKYHTNMNVNCHRILQPLSQSTCAHWIGSNFDWRSSDDDYDIMRGSHVGAQGIEGP